ncbi:MAG: (Fe-S)-binding protein [Polyangiaceae bacterium]|nr:(Fe-S)-binding protein [Polyangiaceae bacterium]
MDSLKLPLLEPHRTTLEKCVYCPKLSRAACPVSNVEGSETVTPWGKMSMAYFAARGDVPIDAAHADPAWACTGCYACRERCDHKNEVATVLTDARAEMFERGAAPMGARSVAAKWEARSAEAARALEAIEREEGDGSSAGSVRVLVGCGYARHAPEVARDALRAVRALTGRPVRAVRACCGLPLLYAGDRKGFQDAARRLVEEVAGADRVIAVDPGCARTLLVEYSRAGVPEVKATLFVDLALAELSRLQPLPMEREAVRYHDPCQLGRGLGRFAEPRAVLARITGRPPEEFLRNRLAAECSGAGGILPVTRPASSSRIAEDRIAEHRALGGGLLVTACAQSLRRFRASGENAADLVSLVARAAVPR